MAECSRLGLTIPWKHLASSNLRNQRKGGRGHSWTYKAALEAIELHALDQCRGDRPRFPKDCPVEAWLTFYEPDLRRRDVPNLFKVILDGIETVAYADDCQVVRGHWTKAGVDRDNPRVEIRLERAA